MQLLSDMFNVILDEEENSYSERTLGSVICLPPCALMHELARPA